MPWDEKAFRERIRARANELGLNDRDVMRRAGVSPDTFTKAPPELAGRTYNTIEAIAEAVGLTVGEAIGATPEALSMTLLEQAVTAAMRALSNRPELLPDAIVAAYDLLSERQRQGQVINAAVLSTVEAMLRRGTGRQR